MGKWGRGILWIQRTAVAWSSVSVRPCFPSCRQPAQLHQRAGYAVTGMAQHLSLACAFAQEIADDAMHTQLLHAVYIRSDWYRSLGSIAQQHLRGDWSGIQDCVVEDGCAGMLVDFFDVLGRAQVETFVGLGHQVADEYSQAPRVGQGLRDPLNEKVGDQ